MITNRITDRIDPGDEVPEADLLEQRTPHDPRSHDDAETGPVIPEALPDGVDEADALDQHTAIPDADEDDYPHHDDGGGAGRSRSHRRRGARPGHAPRGQACIRRTIPRSSRPA